MLHFGRKGTNAFIHTIYIYLFEQRKGGYYTQYIFFNYIIINQVHFQMHALLKCSIFLVVSTYVMIYWRLDTLGITISYVTPNTYTWNFPVWFFFVWNYQVYTIKVIIISFTIHSNHDECSTY